MVNDDRRSPDDRPTTAAEIGATKDVAILQLRGMLERFIDGEDRSLHFANEIEDLVLAKFRDTRLEDDLRMDLATYEPGGGEFLVDEADLVRLFRWVIDNVIDKDPL